MASMGMLGAVSGGADAFAQTVMMDLEEARSTRLENLRTKNAQATNTMSNDQRHANRTAEQAQSNEFSLEQLAKQDEYKKGQAEHSAQVDIDSEATYKPDRDSSGNITGQFNERTGEWSNAGQTASRSLGGQLPADAKMINYLTSSLDMSKEDALSFVKTRAGDSPDQYRRSLIEKFVQAGYTAEESEDEVGKLMRSAYPEQGGAASGGSSAAGGKSYSEIFETLKAGNSDKYSDEEIQKYIDQTYGLKPE